MSVIICAFNEEANIARLIRQVLDGPWTGVIGLDSIIVVDDGSSDGTLGIVEEMARAHRELQVIRHEQRRGKNAGLREAMVRCRSEIMIIADADIDLESGCLIRTAEYLLDHPSLAAVSCINNPLPPRTWGERASRFQAVLISELRLLGQVSLLRLYAIRTLAVARLELPDAVADDLYIMRWLSNHGYSYAVCMDAAIRFRSATGLHDFAKQTLRAWHAIDDLDRLLPAPPVSGTSKGTARAVGRAVMKEPVGFVLYALWRTVITITPATLWMPAVTLSDHNISTSTKNLGV